MPLKAAIYCRVSTEEQAREGFSIAAQKKTLTSYAENKGFSVTRVYIDEGVSGKTTKRPAFRKMLQDAPLNLFQAVLVWKINRFSRKNSDLLNTVEYLSKYGINLVSCSEQFDASSPSGKLMLSMLGSIGEFERDTIVENIRAGMAERACQGLFNGGRILGYDTLNGKLIVNKIEASTVKMIFELYLSGIGYKGIRDILKTNNKKTKSNCVFDISSIRRILKNPVYAGYIRYNKTANKKTVLKCPMPIEVPGIHEAIISKENFDAVQIIIDSRKQLYISSNSYILSSLLKCPVCDGKMTGHTCGRKKDGTYYRYYICLNYKNNGPAACSPNCVNADHIEDIILNYLFSLISHPTILNDIYSKITEIYHSKNSGLYSEINTLEKEQSNKKRILNKYLLLFETDKIDVPTLENKVKDLKEEINNIVARIDELKHMMNSSSSSISYERVSAAVKDFKILFMSLDNIVKKRITASIIKNIYLMPGREIKNIVLNFSFLP